MSSADLETRVSALEAELAKLKAEISTSSGRQGPWWDEISGIFANDPAFEEAMRLGQVARILPAETGQEEEVQWWFSTPII